MGLPQNPVLRAVRNVAVNIQRRRLPKAIQRAYANTTDPEIREAVDFARRHPEIPQPMVTLPASEHIFEYSAKSIQIVRDDRVQMRYVLVNDQPIYFPNEYSDETIRQAIYIALIEQHRQSPHLYCDAEFRLPDRATIVLAGASDGIFALSLGSAVAKGYLFEADPMWRRPLEQTMANHPGRFEIVSLFLSDQTSETSTTLDDFMASRGNIDYLQADVEGAEPLVLEGARNTLIRSPGVQASICVYHRKEHPSTIKSQLESFGLQTRYSRGYFLMSFRYPYIRRAVIYGRKP